VASIYNLDIKFSSSHNFKILVPRTNLKAFAKIFPPLVAIANAISSKSYAFKRQQAARLQVYRSVLVVNVGCKL